MVSSNFDFDRALAYTLSCVKREGLCLKDQQEEAVKRLSEGKDVFVWFPTGYGKSICYQLLPFVSDVKLGRTNAPLVDRSVVLVIFPLVSDSTQILLSVSFIHIFIEIYNCFTACFTVEFTTAPDTPIYNQYQAIFFAHHTVIIEKNRPGDEAKMWGAEHGGMQHLCRHCRAADQFFSTQSVEISLCMISPIRCPHICEWI